MSKANFEHRQTNSPWSITVEKIAITGILAAITLLMTFIPGLGFIPVPNLSGNATTAHIPTILGGVIGGPIVGLISGLVFGFSSFIHSTNAAFKDPLVAIFPRIFIGLVAWGVFAGLVRFNRDLAAILAGTLGSLTNSVLVVGVLVLRNYLPIVLVPTLLPQIIAEAIISAILIVVLTRVFFIIQGRYTHARETRPREELPY